MALPPKLTPIDALTDKHGRRRPNLALLVAVLVTLLCALQWIWAAATIWRLRDGWGSDPEVSLPDWAFVFGASLCVVVPVGILAIAVRRGVGWGLVPMAAICLAVVVWIFVSCFAIVVVSLA